MQNPPRLLLTGDFMGNWKKAYLASSLSGFGLGSALGFGAAFVFNATLAFAEAFALA